MKFSNDVDEMKWILKEKNTIYTAIYKRIFNKRVKMNKKLREIVLDFSLHQSITSLQF